MAAGLVLALISALGTNLAFLFKQRGARAADPVQASRPLHSAVSLLRSHWFVIGWLIAVAAWVIHVWALAWAPLSVVQAVLAGGLLFLGVLAEHFFGFHIGRRQQLGIVVMTVGLVIIGITNGRPTPNHYDLAALIAVESSIFAIGGALTIVSHHHRFTKRAKSLLLGLASGALFGVSDIALKYLSDVMGGHFLAIISPWTLAALVAMIITFYTSARSLQLARGVEVIAVTSAASNMAAIIGGILIFRESIGHGALAIIGRVIAFCLVIVGTALVPGAGRMHHHARHGHKAGQPDNA